MRTPLQFVFDFFTGPEPVVPDKVLVPLTQNQEPATELSTPNRTALPPLPSVEDSVLVKEVMAHAPQGFTHPAANRHAHLQGVLVSYRFERSRRKSIGFMVGADGLVVRSPNWVPLREVDSAVQEKGAWIVAKLQQLRERQTEQFQKAIEW